jgi:hypothetical protein
LIATKENILLQIHFQLISFFEQQTYWAFYQRNPNQNIKDLDVEFETKISEELERTMIRQKLVQIAVQMLRVLHQKMQIHWNVKINNVRQVSKFGPRDFLQHQRKYQSEVWQETVAVFGTKSNFIWQFEVEDKIRGNLTIVYERNSKKVKAHNSNYNGFGQLA